MHRSLHFQLIAIVVCTVSVVLAISQGVDSHLTERAIDAGPARARRAGAAGGRFAVEQVDAGRAARAARSPWCTATARSRRSTSSACTTRPPSVDVTTRDARCRLARRALERRRRWRSSHAHGALLAPAARSRTASAAGASACRSGAAARCVGAAQVDVQSARRGAPDAAHPLDRRRRAGGVDRAHLRRC